MTEDKLAHTKQITEIIFKAMTVIICKFKKLHLFECL